MFHLEPVHGLHLDCEVMLRQARTLIEQRCEIMPHIFLETQAGSFTIPLPLSPTKQDQVEIFFSCGLEFLKKSNMSIQGVHAICIVGQVWLDDAHTREALYSSLVRPHNEPQTYESICAEILRYRDGTIRDWIVSTTGDKFNGPLVAFLSGCCAALWTKEEYEHATHYFEETGCVYIPKR